MANPSLMLVREESAFYLDQDRLWKNIVTGLFEEFILFFAPDLYAKVDWSRKPDSLEQEFHRLFPEKKGKRVVDKLLKVYLKDGKEQWILTHIEIQGAGDKDFPERMFQYFYRIYDTYRQKIFAIALLTDGQKTFKPDAFQYCFHGTNLTYEYNTYKLIEMDEESLMASDNLFALALLAGIYVIRSRGSIDQRFQFKRRLFRLLLQEKQENIRDDVTDLLYFIDFLLDVPNTMMKELEGEMGQFVKKKDFRESSFADMGLPPTIKEFVKNRAKEAEIEGLSRGMEKGMERGLEKGMEKGMAEGKAEGKSEMQREAAVAMLKEGLSVDLIERITKLSKEEIDRMNNEH